MFYWICVWITQKEGAKITFTQNFNVEKEAERGSRGYVFDYEIDRESVKEISTYITIIKMIHAFESEDTYFDSEKKDREAFV